VYFEPSIVVAQAQACPIDFSFLRIEHFAVRPRITVLMEVPQDRHAEHGLIVTFAGTIDAQGIRVFARLAEQLHDAAAERAIAFLDAHERTRLVCLIVDGLPCSDGRRYGGGMYCGDQQQGGDHAAMLVVKWPRCSSGCGQGLSTGCCSAAKTQKLVQPYAAIEVFAASRACVQAAAMPFLPPGVVIAERHAARV